MNSKTLIVLLGIASAGIARDIAPTDRPQPPVLGQVIDRTRPAVVPKFLAQRAVPAGMADRAGAIQFTSLAFGYGGISCGFGYARFSYLGGCGPGFGFGGNWAPGVSFEGGSLP